MNRYIYATLITIICISPFFINPTLLQSKQNETCEKRQELETPSGKLARLDCIDSKNHPTRSLLTLNGKTLIEDDGIYFADSNNKDTIFIYESGKINRDGGHEKLYVIDLNISPARVIAFGVENANNQFHWASWGKKSSAIAIKNNVKFVYRNGNLIPPEADNDLWSNIKPTQFDTSVEQLKPFVHVLTPN